VILTTARSQQSDAQQQVEQQLLSVKQRLASVNTDQVNAQKDLLTAQIAAYTAQLESGKASLTSGEDSISAANKILELAPALNVAVTSIASSGQSTANLVNTPCTVIPINLQVSGNFSSIRDFVRALGQTFPSSIVTLVQASGSPGNSAVEDSSVSSDSSSPIPETSPQPSTTPSPVPVSPQPGAKILAPVSATINLVVYGYGGR